MPKLHHTEKVSSFVTIGVQLRLNGYKNKDAATTGNWYVRIKYPHNKTPHIETLRIPYDGGNPLNKELAIKEAERRALEKWEKSKYTEPSRPTQLRLLAYEWLKECEDKKLRNQASVERGFEPQYEIEGGRGYWDEKQYKNYESMVKNYCVPFFYWLKPDNVDEACIYTTRPQELDKIEQFIRENPTEKQRKIGRPVSPSTILKVITTIRHIYRYAYRQGLVERIPEIRRPKTQLKERARREIEDLEYKSIVEYTRNKYQDEDHLGSITYTDGDGIEWSEKVTTYRDYQYLFHLWIMVIANCGIRPPTSGKEHTMIKWEHLKIDEDTGIATLRRPKEKNHDYTAVIMPSAVIYWEELRRFQKERGIYQQNGYVFAHPIASHKRKGGWNKGDPIKSFRTQWEKMMDDLARKHPFSGFASSPATPQSQKITPSSLRSWFITQRLRHGDVKIERLAGATGTNLEVIMRHYYKFATEKEYDKLTQGGYERDKSLKVIRKDGYYVGHEDNLLGEDGKPLKI